MPPGSRKIRTRPVPTVAASRLSAYLDRMTDHRPPDPVHPGAPADLVVFDLVGTTLSDGGGGESFIVDAFVRAFAGAGVPISPADVRAHRGLSKRDAIARILREHGAPPAAVEPIHGSFLAEVEAALGRFQPMDGARAALLLLRGQGVRVAVGSGLPHRTALALVEGQGWLREGLVQHVTSAERAGAGRPDPAMIRDAMSALGANDPHRVLKVGDTIADVEEGRNAGVRTAAVLSGSQTEAELRDAEPEFLIRSLRELPAVLAGIAGASAPVRRGG